MSGGQYINHFGQVRIRLTGNGLMSGKLISMDGVTEFPLADTNLESYTYKYINKLTNFEQQKAQLELKTTEFGTTFLIRQIIFYIKPVGTDYPQ